MTIISPVVPYDCENWTATYGNEHKTRSFNHQSCRRSV